MDFTRKFDGLADEYTVGRPAYSEELIGCLYSRYGISKTSVIADIGSGTGKFARHLLDRGSEVYCVEPNGYMRHTAERELCSYPNFHSVGGDAENTSLESCSVDFITTAQAFHWFDTVNFRRECSRIIKPGGKIILIWNIRDAEQPVNVGLKRIYGDLCPDFRGFSGGIEEDDKRIDEFFDGKYDYVSFDNPVSYDKKHFLARSMSSSYSLKSSDDNYSEYIQRLTDLFDKCAENDTVTVIYHSVAYIGN